MARIYTYVAHMKSSCADPTCLDKVHSILESIPDLTIIAQDSTSFKFRSTQTAFKTAKAKLSLWCIIRREYFEYEEGGG